MTRTNTTFARTARGFSMLELTFVIVVIGVLLGVAAYSLSGGTDRAKQRASAATLETIKRALQQFNAYENRYPATLNDLIAAKYLENKPLVDGWNRNLFYAPNPENPERPFELRSLGADGVNGTPDDIDGWNLNAPTNRPAGT